MQGHFLQVMVNRGHFTNSFMLKIFINLIQETKFLQSQENMSFFSSQLLIESLPLFQKCVNKGEQTPLEICPKYMFEGHQQFLNNEV